MYINTFKYTICLFQLYQQILLIYLSRVTVCKILILISNNINAVKLLNRIYYIRDRLKVRDT